MIIGGPDAVTHLVERKFMIAQTMEIVTRPDGMELWVCAKGHITPFIPTAPGKWVCCPKRVRIPYEVYAVADQNDRVDGACGLPILPATQEQVAAHDAAGRMCGPEAAALAAATPEDP